MSDHDVVDALLELERSYDDLPDGAEKRIFEAVVATIGSGPDGGDQGGQSGPGGNGQSGSQASPGASPPPPATAFGGLSKLARAAYVALGVVAGASGHAVLSSPSQQAQVSSDRGTAASDDRHARASDSEAALVTAAPVALDPPLPPVELAPAPARAHAAGPHHAIASASAARTSASSNEERADLDVARAALSQGRIDACSDALARHAKTYGDGHFAEERALLTIQALVAGKRYDEARERARQFHARFPKSLFGPAISAAIAE